MMVICQINTRFTFSLFVLVVLYILHMKQEKKKKKSNPVKIWNPDMQVSHLQLTIQNKSAAPVWMISVFVSSLVDMLVWPEPSARMFDVSTFLGQWNSSACFALPEPWKVKLPATKRVRELWEQQIFCLTNKSQHIAVTVMHARPEGRNRSGFPRFIFWLRNSIFLLLLFQLTFCL